MIAVPLLLLPRFDRILLRAAGRLVPGSAREEWRRSWHAELWHQRQRGYRPRKPSRVTADLAVGLVLDALWLRVASWDRRLRGTALLCLGSLLALCLLAALPVLLFRGDVHAVAVHAEEQSGRFLLASLLVSLVSLAIGPKTPLERSPTGRSRHWLRRQAFLAAKTALLLPFAFLLSADVCAPVGVTLPNTAEFLQILAFVLLALVGLRWAVQDQEQRCQQCLHALAAPARVGRPSHNLLEWNGTELACRLGHGLLSVPELETSWCRSSEWRNREPAPAEAAVAS